MLGMDAARQGYYAAYRRRARDSPYLLTASARLMRERGIDAAIRRRIFVDNPARAYAFGEVDVDEP